MPPYSIAFLPVLILLAYFPDSLASAQTGANSSAGRFNHEIFPCSSFAILITRHLMPRKFGDPISWLASWSRVMRLMFEHCQDSGNGFSGRHPLEATQITSGAILSVIR